MPKFNVSFSKKLKLTNVVSTKLDVSKMDDMGKLTEQMGNYIKSKGYQPVGPFIQYMSGGGANEVGIEIKIMQQSSGYIKSIERPFEMSSVLRIPNCLYTRYCGGVENIRFAYDKLTLTAYEDEIELKGNSYTIVLNESNGQIVADIFMECVADE